jgi:hypothetical protein
MVVDTLPPASEIFLKTQSTEDFQLVGKAPYKVSLDEFRAKFKVDGSFAMEARNAGYTSQQILVSEIPNNADLKVFLNLKAEAGKNGAAADPEVIAGLNLTLDIVRAFTIILI